MKTKHGFTPAISNRVATAEFLDAREAFTRYAHAGADMPKRGSGVLRIGIAVTVRGWL
jgi:hypothetical protein